MIIWWHIDSPAAIVRLNFSINSTCDLRSTMSCANSKKSKRGSNVTVFPAEPTSSAVVRWRDVPRTSASFIASM